MSKQFYCAVVASSLLLGSVFSANAELSSSDFKVSGDNSVITDSISGNQWLSLNETFGLSINDVSSQLGSGGNFDGWSLPNYSNVLALAQDYLNADLFIYDQYNRAIINYQTTAFMSFMSSFGTVVSSGSGSSTLSNTYGLYKADIGPNYNLIGIDIDESITKHEGTPASGSRLWIDHTNIIYTSDFSHYAYGIYLFKDSETVAFENSIDDIESNSINNVSTPLITSTGALLLGMLGGFKRRKAA